MSTKTEETVDLDMNLEDAIPCEAILGCAAEAEWSEVNRCCGQSWSACTPHKEADSAIRSSGRLYHCTRCNAFCPGSTWRKL